MEYTKVCITVHKEEITETIKQYNVEKGTNFTISDLEKETFNEALRSILLVNWPNTIFFALESELDNLPDESDENEEILK